LKFQLALFVRLQQISQNFFSSQASPQPSIFTLFWFDLSLYLFT
jgi:hypothetical protein